MRFSYIYKVDRKALNVLFQMILVLSYFLISTSFGIYSPTTEGLNTAASEGSVCNSYATCLVHTISHGTEWPNTLRLVQETGAERVNLQRQESGRPSVPDATAGRVTACCQRSAQKSTRRACGQLQYHAQPSVSPCTSVCLCNHTHFK
jgi:hypothetical protein